VAARRILGIDPGSRRTGYGVVDVNGNNLSPVAWGVIRTDELDSFPDRLHRIHQGLTEAILAHRPTEAAVENVFLAKNAASALKLGHARGAALATVVRRKLAVSEYAPRLIKQSLVGGGAADKNQVQHMVRLLLRLPDTRLQADAADALAIALTHAHMSATQMRTGVAVHQLRRRGT
jgi:crossover junction endodeoxyribonuclease RuvC